MLTRKQLQQEITELDAEINRTLAGAGVQGMRLKVNNFPSGNWGLFAIIAGWWLLGDMVSPRMHIASHKTFFYLGLIFGAAAVLRTLAWMLRRGGGGTELSPEYREATERIRQLQDRRRELQKQLKELDEG